jgi:hypothetical protein
VFRTQESSIVLEGLDCWCANLITMFI